MTQQFQQNNINVPRGARLISEDIALNLDDDLVEISTAADPVTVTLPLAAQIPGQEIKFKANDAGSTGNAVTIAALPGENIDGNTSISLTEDQASVCLKSDGKNWRQVCGGAGCCAPAIAVEWAQAAGLVFGKTIIVLPNDTQGHVIRASAHCVEDGATAQFFWNENADPGDPIPIVTDVSIERDDPPIADSLVLTIDIPDGAQGGNNLHLVVTNPCGCCAVWPAPFDIGGA